MTRKISHEWVEIFEKEQQNPPQKKTFNNKKKYGKKYNFGRKLNSNTL